MNENKNLYKVFLFVAISAFTLTAIVQAKQLFGKPCECDEK